MPPRRDPFRDKVDRIHALAALPPAQATPELKRFLADASGYIVGEAAKVTADLDLRTLTSDLIAALLRLFAAGVSADKGCHGKKRLLDALLAFDAAAPDAYLAGIRYVQMEPAFGDPIDTASGVRGLSAHALVRMDHPAAVQEVTPLLMDPEPDARAAAADALASTGQELCGPILHLKVLAGDKEPDVLGACYRGMLALEPRRYLSVVAKALGEGEEIAAIALGESRLPEAFAALKDALNLASSKTQDSILLGLALLRSEEANAFLIEVVKQAPEARAAAAIDALGLHRHDEKLSARVREVAEARGSRRLLRALTERFGK